MNPNINTPSDLDFDGHVRTVTRIRVKRKLQFGIGQLVVGVVLVVGSLAMLVVYGAPPPYCCFPVWYWPLHC